MQMTPHDLQLAAHISREGLNASAAESSACYTTLNAAALNAAATPDQPWFSALGQALTIAAAAATCG